MKVKNAVIFRASESLNKLMDNKIPVKTSSQIAKLAIVLNNPLKVIDDVRNGLVQNHGEKDKDGSVKVWLPGNPEGHKPSPNADKFIEEFNELMEIEEEITFQKVKLPETVAATCDKCDHNMDKPFEVEPSVLMALDIFIEV